MAIPSNRMDEFQEDKRRRGMPSAIMSTWAKSPLYAARWNYFHRPSVWASMASGDQGFRWQGMTGFKTLMAGSAGIGYGGEANRSISPFNPAGWINRLTGYGLGYAGRGLQTLDGRMAQFGHLLEQFGTGMSRGGIAGGIRTAGKVEFTATGAAIRDQVGRRTGRIADEVEKFFGGGYYPNIGGYGPFSGFFKESMQTQETFAHLTGTPIRGGTIPLDITSSYRDVFLDIDRKVIDAIGKGEIRYVTRKGAVQTRKVGILRSLFSSEEEAQRLLRSNLSYTDFRLASSMEESTAQLARSLKFKAGARVMKGVTVGLNIAMFGGLLATGAYKGLTTLTDKMMRTVEYANSIRRTEFGTGIQPFRYQGALTERQRALEAISNSRLNARSAIGNEASLAHDYTM